MGRYDILLQQDQAPMPNRHGTNDAQGQAAPIRRTGHTEQRKPVRANARTVERSNGRRIITRNSFEIYEDQMDSLRGRAFQEKRQGKIGSMSAMVREAIDRYLARADER